VADRRLAVADEEAGVLADHARLGDVDLKDGAGEDALLHGADAGGGTARDGDRRGAPGRPAAAAASHADPRAAGGVHREPLDDRRPALQPSPEADDWKRPHEPRAGLWIRGLRAESDRASGHGRLRRRREADGRRLTGRGGVGLPRRRGWRGVRHRRRGWRGVRLRRRVWPLLRLPRRVWRLVALRRCPACRQGRLAIVLR
jgi:hypothetical protein